MSQHVKDKRTVRRKWVSEAKILSDIRAAAEELGEPLSIKGYSRQAPARGWVAPLTIARRFGSWAGACELLGIWPHPASARRRGHHDAALRG